MSSRKILYIQTTTFDVPEYEIRWETQTRPLLSPEHTRHLKELKRVTGKSITKLVSEVLECYLEISQSERR